MITFENLRRLGGVSHGITEKSDKVTAGLVRGEQVHKDVLAWVDKSTRGLVRGVDALATKEIGVTLGVYTADCVPILLADERSGIVATVHAGWRGTALEIARKAVDGLKIRPTQLQVGIGPAICPKCFEVGDEVARQFSDHLVRASDDERGKFFVDLWQANVDQLVEAGVKRANIEIINRCTLEEDSLYSFRDGDRDSRLVAWVRRDE